MQRTKRTIGKTAGWSSLAVGMVGLILTPGFALADDGTSWLPDSPWPMFRHDLKHTGRTCYTGPSTPTLAWTYQCDDGVVSSPTIGTDGTIYFGAGWFFQGSLDPHFYALNPDGTLKWRFEGAGFFSSPALGPSNTLYVTGLDGDLYAIQDMGTFGHELWSTNLQWPFNLSSPAIGPDGQVYAGSPSFQLYSVDPIDGSITWSWMSDWCIISSPAIDEDGIIYVGSKDHNLYAFDDALEAPIWAGATGTFYDGHLVDSSPAIGADGTIYVGSDQYGAFGQTPVPVDTSFWAFHPDGTLKWSFNTEDGVESSPAIGPDGTIYFGSYDNHLYAVTDAGTEGVLQWRFETGDDIDGSPTVDGDGHIYFGSRDGNIYALYPDGTVKWTFPTGDGIEGSPTIDDRGYLYLGSFDGKLYALGTGGADVGVASVTVPARVLVDETYVPQATVRNYRGDIETFDVSCTIEDGGGVVYSDLLTIPVDGGEAVTLDFLPWTIGSVAGVDYEVTVETTLAGDENAGNDVSAVVAVSGAITCGDGFVEGDEECDDGNTVSGDDCSATCVRECMYCASHTDCVLASNNACDWDECDLDGNSCCVPSIPRMYGDVCGTDYHLPPNGAVNLTDTLCTLNAFGIGNLPNCPNADIAVIDAGDCPAGNGIVNLTDVLKVLDASGAPADPEALFLCDCEMNP